MYFVDKYLLERQSAGFGKNIKAQQDSFGK